MSRLAERNCAPHSFFSMRRKERMRRARCKKEKGAPRTDTFLRHAIRVWLRLRSRHYQGVHRADQGGKPSSLPCRPLVIGIPLRPGALRCIIIKQERTGGRSYEAELCGLGPGEKLHAGADGHEVLRFLQIMLGVLLQDLPVDFRPLSAPDSLFPRH